MTLYPPASINNSEKVLYKTGGIWQITEAVIGKLLFCGKNGTGGLIKQQYNWYANLFETSKNRSAFIALIASALLHFPV